jgi:hypothetical protein
MKKILLLSVLILFSCSKDSEEGTAPGDENVDFFEMVNGKIFIPTSPNLQEGDDDYYGVLVKFAESYNCGDKIGPVDGCGSLIGGLFIKRLMKFTGSDNNGNPCETQTFNNYGNYTLEKIVSGVKYDFSDSYSNLVAYLTSFSFPLKVEVRQYGKTFTYEEVTEVEARSRVSGLFCSNQQRNRFFDD